MSRSKPVHYAWLLVLLVPALAVFVLLRETAFRFSHKEFLWGMCILAPAIVLFTFFQVWRERNLELFARPSLIDQLIPDSSFDKHIVKFILLSLAFEFVMIGFAGPRVIEETIKKKLPEGFQTSEFQLENGFLDFIVDRKQLRDKLQVLLALVEN